MNKIIKISIAVIMLVIQILGISKTVKAASIGEIKDLERGELGYYCIQKWNGSNWIYLTYNQTFYTDTDGKKYIAYCLSPGLPGIGYVSGEKESYQVKIDHILDNDIIWRILKNGYPNKSVEELGLETADDAYFATMQAINAVLRGYTLEQAKQLYCVGKFAINGENYSDIQTRGTKTLNVLFSLIDIGLNGTETRGKFLNISMQKTSELIEENDKYYSQKIKVNSSSEISKFKISEMKYLPQGTYIADIKGVAKNEFLGGEEFKVIIPKDKVSTDIKGEIKITALQKNYPVYFGQSQVSGCQDYALCNNSYANVEAKINIDEKINKSKLTILKVDKETNLPLKGVKFKIIFADGKSKEVVTDDNGKIILTDLVPGKIVITELETVGKYSINQGEIQVNLKYKESKEIQITNELQKGSIKAIKIDTDNEEIRLDGVEFELRDENGNVVRSGCTDKNGELLFENLVVGNYKMVEVKTKDEYVLNKDEIQVEVKYKEVKEVKINNELQKGSIKIVKIDEDNNEIKLKDVKFELRDENNNVMRTGNTDENGELLFENLVVGNYKIVEVETNDKYVLNQEEIQVEVMYNEINEIQICNELQKGSIKIIKVDKDSNEIKLEGVKFELKDESDNVIKIGSTDENGELLFENLVVGNYNVVELETDNKYTKLDKEIKVTVSDNQIQELIIENEKIKEETVVEKKLPKTGGNYKKFKISNMQFIYFGFIGMYFFVRKIKK